MYCVADGHFSNLQKSFLHFFLNFFCFLHKTKGGEGRGKREEKRREKRRVNHGPSGSITWILFFKICIIIFCYYFFINFLYIYFNILKYIFLWKGRKTYLKHPVNKSTVPAEATPMQNTNANQIQVLICFIFKLKKIKTNKQNVFDAARHTKENTRNEKERREKLLYHSG